MLTGRAIPACGLHVLVLEPRGLDAVDERAPHAELADDLVQRRAADEELLGRVREAVERRADEHEDVALGAAQRGPVLVRELVRRDEHAEAADAHGDAEYLRPVVLGTHVHPAEEQADGDRPRVEEHAREERRVFVRFDDEEVTLDVACGEDEI